MNMMKKKKKISNGKYKLSTNIYIIYIYEEKNQAETKKKKTMSKMSNTLSGSMAT